MNACTTLASSYLIYGIVVYRVTSMCMPRLPLYVDMHVLFGLYCFAPSPTAAQL